MQANKTFITHVITSSSIGGAELALYYFLKNSLQSEFTCQVICLTGKGEVAERIEALGVPVIGLDLKSSINSIFSVTRIVREIKRFGTDAVHCWMYHANLLGGLAGRLAGVPVIWGIHHDSLDTALLKRRTILIARLGAYLSRWLPEQVIFCSHSSRQEHIRIGYQEKKTTVIPNGFDTDLFKPNYNAGSIIKKKIGIPSDSPVVGHVGRFNPTKDHLTMIRSAGLIADEHPKTHFIVCGIGVDGENAQLVNWVKDNRIGRQTHLLGQQINMPHIYAAMDILISSSVSEAFPNVIGEAMSCGVPCVVTDVGDSAFMVAGTGRVVPPGDPQKIADAVLELFAKKELRDSLGRSARERVIREFNILNLVKHYSEVYKQVY